MRTDIKNEASFANWLQQANLILFSVKDISTSTLVLSLWSILKKTPFPIIHYFHF